MGTRDVIGVSTTHAAGLDDRDNLNHIVACPLEDILEYTDTYTETTFGTLVHALDLAGNRATIVRAPFHRGIASKSEHHATDLNIGTFARVGIA